MRRRGLVDRCLRLGVDGYEALWLTLEAMRFLDEQEARLELDEAA